MSVILEEEEGMIMIMEEDGMIIMREADNEVEADKKEVNDKEDI